jgi:Protein of unknown function (DUF3467)
MARDKDQPTAPAEETKAAAHSRIDTSNLKSSYCNVCNATSTREEVVLSFGINQSWERGPDEMEIQLQHRVILSPFAAKRLVDVLSRLVKDYETRFGELK